MRDYERAREQGAPLEPMPSLLVVCDEFSELLSAKPDFIDLFVQIGRLGRSLGVHLLLASQRLEEGRLRGLDTHLSYRIGLRTFSAMESRIVLGVPDAYELPSAPGHGYLKDGHRGAGPVQGRLRLGGLHGLGAAHRRRTRRAPAGGRCCPTSSATSPPPADRPSPTGRRREPRRARPGRRRRCWTSLVDRLEGAGPAGAPGVAAAAGRAAHAWTSCCRR